MVAQNVAEIIKNHVSLEIECIDRMYLNGYVPGLQSVGGLIHFVRKHLGFPIASTAVVAPMSKNFVQAIEVFAKQHQLDIVTFDKRQRKDEVTQEYLACATFPEGVLYIGKAQEKASVFRTSHRRNANSGKSYPWISRGTALPNHYYFYILDEDFGPLFVKFCSYFPYAIKVCLNGHEWLKRQLAKEGMAFEALDNGILSCANPARAQELCDSLDGEKIDAVFRKWLARLPHPYPPEDRAAGYCYELSILQAEFSLTQVLDFPRTGRQFFEEVIRENLDIGRPDHVQLIFNRRVIKQTPGTFRTRVLTEGVTPSLYAQYKHTKIKQYHKEGRALRTETTINDTYDFAIGRRLCNLPALREIGFRANRQLLNVETLSHDCSLGKDRFDSVVRPVVSGQQRASALPFGDPRVLILMHALCLFQLLFEGFRNADLRTLVAQLSNQDPATINPGRLTYDLRRLRLHGLIERQPHSNRYRVTPQGIRISLFFIRAEERFFRVGLAVDSNFTSGRTTRTLAQVGKAIDQLIEETNLATKKT
jgi:hypothetical protein